MATAYVEASQPPGKVLGDCGSRVIVQVSEVGHLIFNGHVHVQSPFLGQKAQSVKERLADGLTVKGDGTRIRRQKI